MGTITGPNTEKLIGVVESLEQNWQMGKTEWKATTGWKGGFQVETCARQFTLLADEPDMLCGTDMACNPVEMVLQAYGACARP